MRGESQAMCQQPVGTKANSAVSQLPPQQPLSQRTLPPGSVGPHPRSRQAALLGGLGGYGKRSDLGRVSRFLRQLHLRAWMCLAATPWPGSGWWPQGSASGLWGVVLLGPLTSPAPGFPTVCGFPPGKP